LVLLYEYITMHGPQNVKSEDLHLTFSWPKREIEWKNCNVFIKISELFTLLSFCLYCYLWTQRRASEHFMQR